MEDNMEKLISVIIPLYNRQNVIEECVRSVCAQSHRNLQIILIDDGSTDRSREICRKLAENDSRILLLECAHAGVSGARNAGLDAATGDFVFFIDSDDVIHPRLLEALVRGMEQHGAAIGGTGTVYAPNARWHKVYPRIDEETGAGETEYHSFEETLHAFFRRITPLNLMVGVMMRRDLIADTRFRTDLFIGEDFFFVYQNLIKGTGAVFLKEKWYYYRIHETNVSNNFTFEGFQTRFDRRVLVWQSEEQFGRTENVVLQKRDAFDVYLRCLRQNPPKAELDKMRKVLLEYQHDLLPALPSKLKFYLFVHFPFTCRLGLKLLKKSHK
jgi:glycosyltransferase involved in cell wall biosynthesis